MSNKTTVAVKRRHLPELNIGLVDGVAHTFLTSFDDVNFLLGQTGKRTSGSWVKRLEKLKLVPYHIWWQLLPHEDAQPSVQERKANNLTAAKIWKDDEFIFRLLYWFCDGMYQNTQILSTYPLLHGFYSFICSVSFFSFLCIHTVFTLGLYIYCMKFEYKNVVIVKWCLSWSVLLR